MVAANSYQPGRAWSVTLLLALFMHINFVDKIGIGLVAVPMMDELKLSPTEYGVIAGSFFWLFAVSGIVGGFLANRFHAKPMLLVMVAIWSVAQLPIIFSSSVVMIVISRVLLGIGEGPASPVAFHACYKWFPDHKRNLPISVINLGSGLGLLVAGIGMPLITANWGWRANFIAMAIVGVVWGVSWLIFGAEGNVVTDTALNAGAMDGRGKPGRLPYGVLLRDSTVVGVIVMHFVAYWGLALTLTWLPAYMQKGLSFDAVTSGQLFAATVVIGIPLSLGLSGWSQRMLSCGVSARMGRAVLCSMALLAGGLLFLALPWLPLEGSQKVILLAVASGLTPVIYSLGSAMMGSVTPDSQRGSMLAIENSIASLAGVFAPVVMGNLIEYSAGPIAMGYERGFAVSGALLIVGALTGLIWVNPERSIRRLASISQAAV
ncbi:MFS transporter [Sulfuritalea hydrogenivorans]|uniref:Major facilitator transporter n=1 Tax=Sulfuritalea hydrogenivorans sk43H TaxID=1223802 RepID=W0SBR9_9PROT|nr:MFS transporter [Sulfuritalea hydrogenivorans]BAO28327.1 major facilitator transporter [Sulfuritalea hydrogenivorans sk43H]